MQYTFSMWFYYLILYITVDFRRSVINTTHGVMVYTIITDALQSSLRETCQHKSNLFNLTFWYPNENVHTTKETIKIAFTDKLLT